MYGFLVHHGFHPLLQPIVNAIIINKQINKANLIQNLYNCFENAIRIKESNNCLKHSFKYWCQ